MNVKLIAIDLDGTLLNDALEITKRTKDAISAAMEKGVTVTICTGRMYASTQPYAQLLGIQVPLITYNGALVKNSMDEQVFYERTLPLDQAHYAVKLCREYDCQLNVYLEDRLYVENGGAWATEYARKVRVPLYTVKDMLDFLKKPPTKLLVLGAQDVLQALRSRLSGRGLYLTRSKPHFLEILNAEATKGRGLDAVAQKLSIDRKQVLAIGDNENDIEMFKYAGFSVAMENAEPEVKLHADYITASNEQEGVAKAIERLVLETDRGRKTFLMG